MVSYFLRWTLLTFFSSIPDKQSQQIVPQWGRITCAAINTSIEVQCPLLWEFWIYNFSQRILERVCVGSIVNIRNECLFFWVHGGMNRSAEQTNHPRTASRFTRFVCPALRFIPPWTQKKRHSFLKNTTPFCCLVRQMRYMPLLPTLTYPFQIFPQQRWGHVQSVAWNENRKLPSGSQHLQLQNTLLYSMYLDNDIQDYLQLEVNIFARLQNTL